MDGFRFLREFISRPKQIGALWPSSPRLAQAMVDWIDWKQVRAVVEFGPGTGVFTSAIVRHVVPETRVMAIEINPRLAALLAERFPSVTVCAESVVRVAELCRENGIEQVDAVICGLPWANFSVADQQAFLTAMLGVLRPQGYFASFAYLQGMLLPAAWRFRRTLGTQFEQVAASSTVWRNVPPAFVYQCRKA